MVLFLRTLSARILLGFAVLIVTFGATTVVIVSYIEDVADEIRVIRTGYLKLALATKDLEGEQGVLYQYIRDDVADAGSPTGVVRQIRRMREERDRLLASIEATLESMKDLPRGTGRWVKRLRQERVTRLRETIASLDASYAELLAAPPIERLLRNPTPPFSPASLEAARRAHRKLIADESRVVGLVTELAEETVERIDKVAALVELNGDRLRQLTLWTGISAVLAGLLITLWATINLRPLGRLRDAAKRIGRGEHAHIDDRGPTEVADLAREFNVMARAIEERERELVRSERLAAVGKMAAMITHEVRNPLSSIALNVELLGDELDGLPEEATAEARALCRSITAEVDRLTAITEEYLAFARLPKPRLQPEPVNDVVASLARFVREDLAARGVTLEVTLADAAPRAMLDEGQLRQSLLNLVRNAAEALAGRGGGTIQLITRRAEDGRVELEVADDGPGIPEEARARLFDPFYTTKDGGTGLGLALTHQIVRDHGGEITVTSPPGGGAVFVVALPALP